MLGHWVNKLILVFFQYCWQECITVIKRTKLIRYRHHTCLQVWSDTFWGWKQKQNDGDQGTFRVDPEATMFWGFLFIVLFNFNFYYNYVEISMPYFSFSGPFVLFCQLTFLLISQKNDVILFSTQKTSFMLFLNKFDIFEKKILKVRTIWMLYILSLLERYHHFSLIMSCIVQVPLNVCEWFKDYQPVSTGKQEIEHAYE